MAQTRVGGWSEGGPRVRSGEGEGRVGGRSSKRVQTVAGWCTGPRGWSEGGPRGPEHGVRERRQRRGSEVARLQGSG